MKKIVIVLLGVLVLCGCSNQASTSEEKVMTCREDLRYDIYALTNENHIYSSDGKNVSSVRTSSVYSASFDDTDFTHVKSTLEALEQDYKQNYKDVKTNLIEEESQIVYTIEMPFNEVNKAQLKKINPDIFEGDEIPIEKYQAMLTNAGAICQ